MRAVVIIPTYNEAENIERFLTQVRRDAPNTDILVVDDNSPDGTAQIAETVAQQLGSIKVLNRTGKRGYAAASREAMQSAIDSGYEVIATMDADFSHDPLVLEQLIAQVANGSSLVIGSRYVAGGKVTNWTLFRRVLSKVGNLYTAFCLQLKIKDCTSGFRAYSAKSLVKINLSDLTADGYAFLTEMAFVISRNGLGKVTEVPINYVDRAFGDSKMNTKIMRESMALVTRWGIALRTGIGRKHLPR
ncbi:MAG: polyprenol monophosphomannose synthase [Actinobacteria bacterium]|nr:polyprenol monophosphomannose synthase [Actinomycetota bacterium]